MKLLSSAILVALLYTGVTVSKFAAYTDEETVYHLKLPVYNDDPTIKLAARAEGQDHHKSNSTTATSGTILPTISPISAAAGLRVPAILAIPTIVLKALAAIPGALADAIHMSSDIDSSESRVGTSSTNEATLCCDKWAARGCRKYVPCPGRELVTPIVHVTPADIDCPCCYSGGCIQCPVPIPEVSIRDIHLPSLIALEEQIASSANMKKPIWCCFSKVCLKYGTRPRLAFRKEEVAISLSAPFNKLNTTNIDNDNWCCNKKYCYACTETPHIYIEPRKEHANQSSEVMVPQRAPAPSRFTCTRICVPRFFVTLSMISRSLGQFLGQKCTDYFDSYCHVETRSIYGRTNRTENGRGINETHEVYSSSASQPSAGSSLRAPSFVAILTFAKNVVGEMIGQGCSDCDDPKCCSHEKCRFVTGPLCLRRNYTTITTPHTDTNTPTNINHHEYGDQQLGAAGWPAPDSAATSLRLPYLFTLVAAVQKVSAVPMQQISTSMATPSFEMIRKSVSGFIFSQRNAGLASDGVYLKY